MQAQTALPSFIQPVVATVPAAAGPRAPLDAGAAANPFNAVLTQEIAAREQAHRTPAPATPGTCNVADGKPADKAGDETARVAAAGGSDATDETDANAAQDIAALSPALAAMMASLVHTPRDAAQAGNKGALAEVQGEETNAAQAVAATALTEPALLAAALVRDNERADDIDDTTADTTADAFADDSARLATMHVRADMRAEARDAMGDKERDEMRDAAMPRGQTEHVKDDDANADVLASRRAALTSDAGTARADSAKTEAIASNSLATDKSPPALFGTALQSASAAAAAAAAPLTPAAAAAKHLAPPVGTTAWDQALAQRVTWMVAGVEQSASLTLNPPELGPLQVILNLSQAQAEATFIASQPEVRQALEAALPKLREMLGNAGIELGQASVSSGSPESRGQFSQPPRTTRRNLGNDGAISAPALPAAVTRVTNGRGLVDTFA